MAYRSPRGMGSLLDDLESFVGDAPSSSPAPVSGGISNESPVLDPFFSEPQVAQPAGWQVDSVFTPAPMPSSDPFPWLSGSVSGTVSEAPVATPAPFPWSSGVPSSETPASPVTQASMDRLMNASSPSPSPASTPRPSATPSNGPGILSSIFGGIGAAFAPKPIVAAPNPASSGIGTLLGLAGLGLATYAIVRSVS